MNLTVHRVVLHQKLNGFKNDQTASSARLPGSQSCKIAYPSVSRKIGKWKFRANLRSQNLKQKRKF